MFTLLLPFYFAFLVLSNARTEEERLQEYYARNYKWPIEEFSPNTPGWNKLMQHRLRQVAEIADSSSRFEGYAQTLSAALVQPNFTEHGFGLARAPDDLMEALRQGIHDGLAEGPREEYYIAAITGDRPWFIDRPDLTKRVLNELHHFPETWANMELTPVTAYGFRLYRNQSSLHMHVDKSETHIISFILHIDSSEDSEPWPILIEDLHGTTHEVTLTSGDILFYESSKCFHGRPRKFNGSWYSSVFVHFYPTLFKDKLDRDEKVFALPPGWDDQPTTKYEIPLATHGTSFEEPGCPHGWCGTEYSKKWSGPGKEGYWIAPTGEEIPFDPKMSSCRDKDVRCAEYLSWRADECDKNPGYMKEHCTKTCNACKAEVREEL